MNPVIGIIGTGAYGRWYKAFFERLGLTVICSDSSEGNQQIVEQADWIIFCLPITVAVGEMQRLAQFSRKGQLWMDITGLKQEAVAAMLCSDADVIGLHPMFAPGSETWRGLKVVYCPARVGDRSKLWFKQYVLDPLQPELVGMRPVDHDTLMGWVQCAVHFMTLVLAGTFARYALAMSEMLGVASPFYRITLSLIGRILKLSEKSTVYRDMLFCNPHAAAVIRAIRTRTDELGAIVEARNADAFDGWLHDCREYVGRDQIEAGSELINFNIGFMAALSDRNSVRLYAKVNRDGLLADITRVFADYAVGLEAIYSFKQGDKVGFHIGFVQPLTDERVAYALVALTEQLGVTCEQLS